MSNFEGTNFKKKNGVVNGLFELSNTGYNNAEILTASDYYEIPAGGDVVAADTIDLQAMVPKGCRIINAELYSNEALGGAAEFSLGIKANDEFPADDPVALIASAVLGAGAANAELSNFALKGLELADDAELYATVIAPSVVGASAKKLHVTVYYINE